MLANDEESEPEQERQVGRCPIFWSSRAQKIWQDHILQRETCESMKQESLWSKFFHAQGMCCLTKIIILCLGILVLYKSSLILRFPSSFRHSLAQWVQCLNPFILLQLILWTWFSWPQTCCKLCWQHDFANPLMYRKNNWNLDEKTEETSPCIILKQFCISSCRVYKTSRFTSWSNLQSGLPGLSSSCIGVTLFVHICPLPQTVMELTGRWTRIFFSLASSPAY